MVGDDVVVGGLEGGAQRRPGWRRGRRSPRSGGRGGRRAATPSNCQVSSRTAGRPRPGPGRGWPAPPAIGLRDVLAGDAGAGSSRRRSPGAPQVQPGQQPAGRARRGDDPDGCDGRMRAGGGHRVHDGIGMTARAELSSVATSLEELLAASPASPRVCRRRAGRRRSRPVRSRASPPLGPAGLSAVQEGTGATAA